MAHPKHEQVRQRYQRKCGYCGVSEVDVGSELTIDHFRPESAGGDDDDDNLVYACFKCNQFKGDFFPDETDQLNGRRVLHPLLDEISAHMQMDEQSCHCGPVTDTGRFHVELLQLNRPALVEYRLRQRLGTLLAAKHKLLETENRQLRATIAAQEQYIAQLRNRLGLPG